MAKNTNRKNVRMHRDHQEFAVGEVDDVHQAENQRKADGDQPVEQPHQEAARQALENGLGGHDCRAKYRSSS